MKDPTEWPFVLKFLAVFAAIPFFVVYIMLVVAFVKWQDPSVKDYTQMWG